MNRTEVRLQDAEGRGRNGYFKGAEATVTRWKPGVWIKAPISIELEVWSRQRGRNAPIVLEMSPADALALSDELRAHAEAAQKEATGAEEV